MNLSTVSQHSYVGEGGSTVVSRGNNETVKQITFNGMVSTVKPIILTSFVQTLDFISQDLNLLMRVMNKLHI